MGRSPKNVRTQFWDARQFLWKWVDTVQMLHIVDMLQLLQMLQMLHMVEMLQMLHMVAMLQPGPAIQIVRNMTELADAVCDVSMRLTEVTQAFTTARPATPRASNPNWWETINGCARAAVSGLRSRSLSLRVLL